MSKRKGLGRDIENSLEIMDNVRDMLDKFCKMPLKRGLHSNKADEEKLIKIINEALEKAGSLSNMVEDIQNSIRGIKVNKNSRFASRVVTKFLAESL